MKARDVLTADQLLRILPHTELVPVTTPPPRSKPVLRPVPARSPAMVWLEKKMAAGPQPIADLIEEWTRGMERDPINGLPVTADAARLINELTAARTALGLESYEDPDGKFWWRHAEFLDDARE